MDAKKSPGKTLLGTILTIGSGEVAEIISLSGFDWVMIDMEHSALSLDKVQSAIQAMSGRLIMIVRVPGLDEIWIKRVLDTGCDGILVPMIKNAEEARLAVASSKYPPGGRRSVGVARAHGYGATFRDYVESANSRLEIMIQIEHIDGVRNIDQILNVDGISSVFIGPYDLSASMGLMGQPGHPDARKAIDTVKERCRKAGLPWGIFGASPDALKGEAESGCRWLLCGTDAMLLTEKYRELLKQLKSE